MIDAEAELKAVIQDRIEATRAKDARRATRDFAEDVLIFDVVDPLQRQGKTAAIARAEEWFSSFKGEIGFDVVELRIAVEGAVAFSHSLSHASGQTADAQLDMWWRTTTCYRATDKKWTIVHEHNSVPFDPATGNASIALRP